MTHNEMYHWLHFLEAHRVIGRVQSVALQTALDSPKVAVHLPAMTFVHRAVEINPPLWLAFHTKRRLLGTDE